MELPAVTLLVAVLDKLDILLMLSKLCISKEALVHLYLCTRTYDKDSVVRYEYCMLGYYLNYVTRPVRGIPGAS